MSDEMNTAPSNLSITEDVFDEFAASSMYEEDEYITLSDIAGPEDPVIIQPAPEITEMSFVDDLEQPTITELGSAFTNGIQSAEAPETNEYSHLQSDNTLEPQVNEIVDDSEVSSGRPKRNRLKRNVYLSDYTSDDEAKTKSNGVASKKPKRSSSGRGRKKQSKSLPNHELQDSVFEQNEYLEPPTEPSKKSTKRGKASSTKGTKRGRAKKGKKEVELQNYEQQPIDVQPQLSDENVVSELPLGQNIKSVFSNVITSKGSGRQGKRRKNLSDTNSLGSADVSVSNISLDGSAVNASMDDFTGNNSVSMISDENGEAKPKKRGRKKKEKAVVENLQQNNLDTPIDFEEDIALSHVCKKINNEMEENACNFDDDKDDLCLSKLKETLDNNVATDIEIDESVVTNAVVDVVTDESLVKEDDTETKRNSKPLVKSEYEYNVDSVINPMVDDSALNEETEDPYLVEDKSKRPKRRKARKVMHYDVDSDEDPYANVELSDDEPRKKKKGKKGYSDDEYVPTDEVVKGRKVTSSEGSDDDIDDELLKPRNKRHRNTSINKSPKKKSKASDVIVDVKTISPKAADVEDDIEECLKSSIILANEDGKPKTMADEFQNFIAKKIQGTDIKIKKLSSTEPSTSLEIPSIDPKELKKFFEMSTQTNTVSTQETGMQTTSPNEITVNKNAPLSAELSEKACAFLKNVVKTTSELGQLMTEKSEDFITKKINTAHVTDVSKMDYCVKKSFLLFKLAKHNLEQMEEDLANQYEKFLTENGLESCLKKTEKLTPKPKPADDDSDCEIVEGPIVTKANNKKKPAFNPKTVFLNKELSIKIAKKPAPLPKIEPKGNLNVKGRHSVWINDAVMVKKVKATQSFLAQDSRNKKPPDCFVTKKMVSDFFEDYNRKQAQKICAPFISTEWRGFHRNYVCCYFFVKSDKFSEHSMGSASNDEYYTSNGHHLNNENVIQVSQNPEKLISLSLKAIQKHIYKINKKIHKAKEDEKDHSEKKLQPYTLFRLCLKKLTEGNVIDSNENNVFSDFDQNDYDLTVVSKQEVSPLKILCYEKVNDVMNKKISNKLDFDKMLPAAKNESASDNVEVNSLHDSEYNSLGSTCSDDIFEEIDNLLVELDTGYKNGVKSLISICIDFINHKLKNKENIFVNIMEQNKVLEKDEDESRYLQTPKSLKAISLETILRHLYYEGSVINKICIDRKEEEYTTTYVTSDSLIKEICIDRKEEEYTTTHVTSDSLINEICIDTEEEEYTTSLDTLECDSNDNVEHNAAKSDTILKYVPKNVVRNLSDICFEVISMIFNKENSLLPEEDIAVSVTSQKYTHAHKVKKLADICFDIISKATNDHSVDTEDTTNIALTINSINTMSEEAFHNIGDEYAEQDNLGDDETAFYSDNDYDGGDLNDTEDTQQDIEPEENSWVSQVQLKELKSCFIPTKKNNEKQIVHDEINDDRNYEQIVEHPVMVHIKQEPEEVCESIIDPSIVKSEPNLDEMTVIPDSVVTKQEPIDTEIRANVPAAAVDSMRRKSYDMNQFESFVASNKMIYALNEIGDRSGDIYSQSAERVRRQYDPDSDSDEVENFESDSLLVPHTFEPLPVETAKTSLMESSSEDETNKKADRKKKLKKQKPVKKQPPPPKAKAPAPPPPPPPENDLMRLTRRMRDKIRQEEKKLKSSDEEPELPVNTKKDKSKNNEKSKSKANDSEISKSKANDSEIQVNNVDSTERIETSLAEEKFTGFTTIDQNEISNYQKYAKFVYDKILPKVTEEINSAESAAAANLDKSNDNSEERHESPVFDSNEPVELLECEPTMPVFDDVPEEPKPKKKLRGPKRFAKEKQEEAKQEEQQVDTKEKVKPDETKQEERQDETKQKVKKDETKREEKQDETKQKVKQDDRKQKEISETQQEVTDEITDYVERDGWHCYPMNLADGKLLGKAEINLDKLPESFVDMYFRYQDVTQAEVEDEEVNRLINIQTLNNRSVSKELRSKTKSKGKRVNDEQIAQELSRGPTPSSDHLDELTPSEDEHHVDDELPPPVPTKSSENNLAKNLLMNDSDSDGGTKTIKKEKDEDMDTPLLKRRSKRKEPEVLEHPENLMLTADKMMNKELNLLHAPVSLTNELPETKAKDSSSKKTRPKQRNSARHHRTRDQMKAEDDSSSEEEKQWVTTKEKLLKRMGKKTDTALMDDAKRAKLVSEFIERRGDACEARNRQKKHGGRRMSRKHRLEREKQLKVLSRELYGESSTDMVGGRTGKVSTSYFKGRRNIRAVIDKKSLQRSTVLANMEEFERKCRLNQRQAQLREVLRCDEDVNVVVIDGELCLEYSFEEKRPVVSVHPFFTKVMKAHQYEGVKFMWDACFESIEKVESGHPGGGCILAHCMGLGKTLQVLALLHTVLTHPQVGMQRVLVCCPLSTVLNWVDEIHKWIGPVTDQIKVFELSKLKKTYERAYQLEDWYNGGGIFIIGYELFRSLSTLDPELDDIRPTIINKIRTALLDPGPDIIVCDEGHLLKNDASVLAVAMSRVVTKRRIVLTGTPMQNNLREYYCMVNFIKPNLLGTYAEYSNRFENPIMNGQHRDSQEEDIKLMKQRTHILHKVLEGCLQRQEASVLYPYLPKKHEYTVFISQTQCQWDLYKHYLQNYANETTKHTNILKDFHILQKIWSHPHVLHNFQMRAKTDKLKTEKLEDDLAREDLASEDIKPSATEVWWLQYLDGGDMLDTLQASNKFAVVFSILEECVRLGDKVLIFSTSLVTLDSLEYFLNKINKWSLGQEYYRLDGSVPPEVRQKWCREFNAENNHKTKLFLISTRAGCLGLNMVAANRVIILDTSWNPAHDIQSIFRVYRFGQKKDCYIYRLVALGTMEQKIYERSVTKQAVACRVVDEQQIDRHYNMAELTELYRYDESGTSVPHGVAASVSDVVLLRVARVAGGGLHAATEHDSLLRGSSEQGLPEHERHALWEQFQQEQTTRQMQNKLIPSFLTQQGNASLAIQNPNINATPEVKTEQSETATETPAAQGKKEGKKKKKKGKKTIEQPEPQIQEPIIKEEQNVEQSVLPDIPARQPVNEEEIVVKILNRLIRFTPRIQASVITELASNVRNIIAMRRMPDGYDKNITHTINGILESYFPSPPSAPPALPALTDVTPDPKPKRGRPRKAPAETPPQPEITPKLEMPTSSRSARLSARRQKETVTAPYDEYEDHRDYQDDDYDRNNSATDSASEMEYDPGFNKKKTKGKSKAKDVSKPMEVPNTNNSQANEQMDSILLSDDDVQIENPPVPQPVSQPVSAEPEVPLHPSLLANQNFIKIVAHTYLEGNPMLDEDAATLAAKYSTDKALKEFEKTGKSITSGPIYDIAKKVLGIDVLIKLNENDPPIRPATETKKPIKPIQTEPEIKTEPKELPTKSEPQDLPPTEVTAPKRRSTIKAKVTSDLMPRKPVQVQEPMKIEPQTPLTPEKPETTVAQPKITIQKPGPKSAKPVKTTMFSVRPGGMGTSSTVIPIGLIQNSNVNSDGPEESILPDDDVSIISDAPAPPQPAPATRNNPPPLILNRLISGSNQLPLNPNMMSLNTNMMPLNTNIMPVNTNIGILNTNQQTNLVTTDFIQPFIIRGPNGYTISTQADTYGVVGNLMMTKPPTLVNVTQAIQRPSATVTSQTTSNDVVCLDSDEETVPETTPVVQPTKKRSVALKSTTKQSVKKKEKTNKDTNKVGNIIKIVTNPNKHLIQVPTSMVPPAFLVGQAPVTVPTHIALQASRSNLPVDNSATQALKHVPLPLCKPGNILRFNKSGNVEIISQADDEVTIIDDGPGASEATRNTENIVPSVKKSVNQPASNKVTPKKSETITSASTPEKYQPSPAKSLEEPTYSKPQTAKRSRKRMISSSESSSDSSRAPSPQPVDDPLSILRDVVHIKAPEEAPARVEPLKLQRVDNEFKTINTKDKSTVGSTSIVKTSVDGKKITPPNTVSPDNVILQIKKNVGSGKPSYVIKKGSTLAEAVADAIKKIPPPKAPEVKDPKTAVKINKNITIKGSSTMPKKTVMDSRTNAQAKVMQILKPGPGTSKPTAGTNKSIVGTNKYMAGTSRPMAGTSKPMAGTSKPTILSSSTIKKRPAPLPLPPPKKKKTEMTLKDFNIDDIDDIIELD